ncbi:hypothetical protein NP233_g178 [Leucocoprinus birnbaumii]|uniref:Uncharacterized protein n=1 Tax=Leucocoprinus birnbaumii TaxID=56174 RepID=A0AAD5W3D9_9AGAR|nr:hypothetical protein NP233_g178 [Leucocoprinus birnbaumii]
MKFSIAATFLASLTLIGPAAAALDPCFGDYGVGICQTRAHCREFYDDGFYVPRRAFGCKSQHVCCTPSTGKSRQVAALMDDDQLEEQIPLRD